MRKCCEKGAHHMVSPCGETLLSRGEVSSLPLNVPMQTHALPQGLVQEMPSGGGGWPGTTSTFVSASCLAYRVVITRSLRRTFAYALRLVGIAFPLVTTSCH